MEWRTERWTGVWSGPTLVAFVVGPCEAGRCHADD